MAEEIAQLIADITRPGGSVGDVHLGHASSGQRRASSAMRRRPALGWSVALAVVGLAGGAALWLLPSTSMPPQGRTLGREPIPAGPRVAAVQVPEPPAVIEPSTAPSSAPPFPTISDRPRIRPAVMTGRRRSAGADAARVDARWASLRRPAPERDGSGLSSLDRPSPHLTGAALDRAVAEDAVVTRQVNLDQLHRGADPTRGSRP